MSRFRKFNKEETSKKDVVCKDDLYYTNEKQCCRARCWVTLLYPESCASDWVEYLKEHNIPCFISPKHDKDTDEDGNLKKSHYHLLFYFEGKVSYKYIKKIIKRIKSTGCFVGYSKKQYSRYLCHLDNPEKHRYDVNDVISVGGLDYFSTIKNKLNKSEVIGEIMEYCDANRVYNLAQLMRYAKTNREDWFNVMINGSTYVIKEYMQAAQNTPFEKDDKRWGIHAVISNT